jgi:class 3 adenylate cyclase
MPQLSASDRSKLPDSAFAYVDSKGSRRLPIHDAAHVRNALARFGQVRFESDEARNAARERLLKAATRHGIVPIGFISAQIRSDQRRAAAARVVIELAQIDTSDQLEAALRSALGDPSLRVLRYADGGYLDRAGTEVPAPSPPLAVTHVGCRDVVTALVHAPATLSDPDTTEAVSAAVQLVIERERLDQEARTRPDLGSLPTGFISHLFTDIEGSTPLLAQLGDRYAALLAEVREIIRQAVVGAGGYEVEARADEFYAVFESADEAVRAGVAIQRVLGGRSWVDDVVVRVRCGLHTGEVDLTGEGYVGISVHTAARVVGAAHGGQILASASTVMAVEHAPSGVSFRPLGHFSPAGIPEPVELFEVEAEGLATGFPPPRVAAARTGLHARGPWLHGG